MAEVEQTTPNGLRALRMAQQATISFESPGQAWLNGLAIGAGLGSQAPKTARALRIEIERMNGIAINESPERVEIALRGVVDVFDQSLDEETT